MSNRFAMFYEVSPHVGVGPIRFGMSQRLVRSLMPGPRKSFRKAPINPHETDAFHGASFQVFYGGAEPVVEYIELSRDSGFCALYRGIDIFDTPAEEVIAHLSSIAPFDPNHEELGHSYIFPVLDLSLWRPTVPESPEDAEGRQFSTIGAGGKGYYGGGA